MIDLDKEMAEQGYVAGAPQSFDTSAHCIEAELCENYGCQICGKVGLVYRQFVEHHTQSFRSFAECPNCGWAEEL
ncbi:MAG: hypothetical protein ACYS8Z_18165 [Planctomycetota bacterium]|jgi:hypothetical protein